MTMTKLAKQFFDHSITRRYIALAWGDIEKDGRVEGYIGRSLKNRLVMDIYDDEEKGKWSATNYTVLERLGYVTLISCELETGRTHQIRAHMQHIGHPLFSDASYGGDKILKGTTFTKYKQFVSNCFELCPRQALHAQTLGFVHPTTQKYMEFEAPLPADFDLVLNKWRNYALNSQ
jgi:23S rRNA pseudouridine1911/1915/1917 synthase